MSTRMQASRPKRRLPTAKSLSLSAGRVPNGPNASARTGMHSTAPSAARACRLTMDRVDGLPANSCLDLAARLSLNLPDVRGPDQTAPR